MPLGPPFADFDYDFIVTGAGAAGRSFVYQLLDSAWRDARVLLLDREAKNTDDRTWSFWEAEAGPFEAAVRHRWPYLWVYNGDFSRRMDIAPFTYKMILASDYYRFTDERFARAPRVEQRRTDVREIRNTPRGVAVTTAAGTYTARWCIDSTTRPAINKSAVNYLDQHFRGWFIESEEPVFRPDEAVMMDFRTPQEGEFRFLYVLPTSPTEALVEVAIFSNRHQTAAGYDQIIENYLKEHWPALKNYRILRTEAGNIPMTDYAFPSHDDNIVYVGMNGGDTRASTGYTFLYIHRRVARMIAGLVERGDPRVPDPFALRRHRWYDGVMLEVLEKQRYPGAALFQSLFEHNPPQRLLRFLNAESGLLEEVALMSTMPVGVFARTALGAR